jgi:hypothetical protein
MQRSFTQVWKKYMGHYNEVQPQYAIDNEAINGKDTLSSFSTALRQ